MAQGNDRYRTQWGPTYLRSGALGGRGGGASVRGLLLRGVVLSVYEVETRLAGRQPLLEPRCDVYVYSGMRGMKWAILSNVMITYDSGGLHDGSNRLPNPTTKDLVTGLEIDSEGPTNPADMDGDHVLVGFLDDDIENPVILRYIQHPRANLGNEERPQDVQLTNTAERSDLRKFRGTVSGADAKGNFIVDARYANTGETSPSGQEARWGTEQLDPDSAVVDVDGSSGNVSLKARAGALIRQEIHDLPDSEDVVVSQLSAETLKVFKASDNAVTIQGFGSSTTVSFGDGAKSAVIAEALQTWWDTTVQPALAALEAAYLTHTHNIVTPAAGSPVGPAIGAGVPTPATTIPSFDSGTISSKVKFPDG